MSDYRSLLERDLRRAGPASFSLDDLERRRRRRAQRIAAVAVALALAAVGIAGTVGAIRSWGPEGTAPVGPPASDQEAEHGSTKGNGAAATNRYGILGGQVVFYAADPWFSPWFSGVVPGDESILVGAVENGYFAVLSNPLLPKGVCPSSGSPASADELAASIAANPDLDASAPVPVTVGGVDALVFEVVPTPGAQICRREGVGERGVPVVMHQDNEHAWSVDHGHRMRIYLLDVTGDPGRTLAIMIVGPRSDFDRLAAAAETIVKSFEFDAG